MEYTSNGFIVTEGPELVNGIGYYGVDTNVWPIGQTFSSQLATEIKEIAYVDLAFPLLIDLPSALQYYSECNRLGISPRLLYCETECKNSSVVISEFCNSTYCTFLGYDYAYPSGDYYSAVANDIIYRKDEFSIKWKTYINQYGLISSEKLIQLFAIERMEALQKNPNALSFETGNFVIFRVFSVDYAELIKHLTE